MQKLKKILIISDIEISRVLHLWDPGHGVNLDGSHNPYIEAMIPQSKDSFSPLVVTGCYQVMHFRGGPGICWLINGSLGIYKVFPRTERAGRKMKKKISWYNAFDVAMMFEKGRIISLG